MSNSNSTIASDIAPTSGRRAQQSLWVRVGAWILKQVAWIVLLLALLVTLWVWNDAKEALVRDQQAKFENRVSEVSDAVLKRIGLYEQVLRGSVGLFVASESVGRTEFKEYVASLKIQEQYPGIQGIGFAAHVPAAGLEAHLSTIRAEGFPDYAIRPPGARVEYTPIIYIEPFDLRNQRAFGFDMFSEANRRAAMERALDTGETSISRKVTLIQEANEDVQAGMMMYLPVYMNGTPHNTPAERRANLVGYVFSAFRLNNLMNGILGKQQTGAEPDIDIELYDGAVRSADNLLYDDDGVAHALVPPQPGRFTLVRSIDLYGHTWSSYFTTRQAFHVAFDNNKPLLILLYGTVLSVMLSWLIWMFANQRRRALEMARHLTGDLRNSEAVLSATINTALDGVVQMDSAGIITSWNNQAENIFGWTRVEAIGRIMHETIIPPMYREAHIRGKEHFLATGEGPVLNKRIEITALHRDGHEFPIELSITPLKAADKYEFSAFFRDLTEQKQASQIADRMVSIIKFSSDAINSVNLEGTIKSWNPAAEKMYGYSAEEIIGQSVEVLYHPESPKQFAEIKDIIQTGLTANNIEVLRVRKDGSTMFASVTVSPIFDIDGAMIGSTSISRDLTELKKAEQKFRVILESSPDAMVIIDETGTVTIVNFQTEKMFGFSRDEMLGQPVELLIPGRFQANIPIYLDRVLADPQAQPIGGEPDLYGRRKDGHEFPIEISLSPIDYVDAPLVVATVHDVTEHRQMIRRLEELNELRNEFVAVTTHDIRSPMASISGYAHMLVDMWDTTSDDKKIEYLKTIVRNTENLAKFVEDVLQVARIETGEYTYDIDAFDISALVQKALDEADGANVDRRFELIAPEDTPLVLGDKDRLWQVLTNLLSNAVKFSPSEEHITVRLSCSGDSVQVSVTDRGIGIANDDLAKLFQKFGRISQLGGGKVPGNGLGLFICKTLVEAQGGRIWCESSPGQGSTFFFTIPVAP